MYRRRYDDLSGSLVERPSAHPPGWRVACYPIVMREGRVLMVEPVWAARWELPGGGVEVEDEETLAEAAARECFEETGYRVTVEPASLRFVQEAFFSIAATDAYFHSLIFTVLGTVSEEPDPQWEPIPEEIRRVAWIDLSTTPDAIHPIHRKALADRGLAPASPPEPVSTADADLRHAGRSAHITAE